MQKQVNGVERREGLTLFSVQRQITCARYASAILGPVAVSVPLVILVSAYHSSGFLMPLAHAGLALFFLCIGPLVYILLGVRSGKLSDFDVSKRSERIGPFLFGLLSVMSGLLVLVSLHASTYLETLMLIALLSDIVLLVTTWWWKISVHAATLAGALTLLTALYGVVVLPFFLLLGLVCWSRVFLHRHTIAQVITGSLVNIGLTLMVLIWRGF